MRIDLTYKPTPKQKMFHASVANEVLYGGAAGGGKSRAIVEDALMRCMMFPKTHAYLFRRTYPELQDTLIKEAREHYPRELGQYNVGRKDYEMINGSVIHFRHCASVSDMHNYDGAEIQWLYIDELTSFEFEIFTHLKTRLRAVSSLGIVPVVRCASNPGNIGHSWVKSYFVDAAPFFEMAKRVEKSDVTGLTRTFTTQYIPAFVTDNPYISKDYIFELERKPKALRDALLFGKWDAFEGQVFTEWVNDRDHYWDGLFTHVVEPYDIPPHWKRYMSFDHGYSRPFSCQWWAVNDLGALIMYREWYGSDGTPNKGVFMTPKEIARGILEREKDEIYNNLHITRVADPAIFDRSRGDSVADQMRDLGDGTGVIFQKGDNNRMNGLMQVHERLRFDKLGHPGLQVFETCKDFIRTFPTLPYSQTKVEDVDTDAEDHCVVGNTKVLTDQGWLTIEDHLDTMRYVISHDGVPHRCYDVRKTQENVDVFTLETEDGRKVTATANHRFMMADGSWKRLDQLRPGDQLAEVAYAGDSCERHNSGVQR